MVKGILEPPAWCECGTWTLEGKTGISGSLQGNFIVKDGEGLSRGEKQEDGFNRKS